MDHPINLIEQVKNLLVYIGEDPTRRGLVETPLRYISALKQMTVGYNQSPQKILSKTFDDDCDEMVVVSNIEFHSLCEHHLMPFHGVAHVGYIPTGRVVGLSKIPRLVHCFAKRLQIQERLTQQIAKSLMNCLAQSPPLGAACIIKAHHTCMSMRGIKCSANLITSSMLGAMRDKPEVRDEFLKLAQQ